MSEQERLYTLDEARRIVLRERCATEGHDLNRIALRHDIAGRVCIEVWECRNCDVDVTLSYPED